mmetsp:Transcript_2744/g.4286  ORF Transcript_2744/g.4286 Transcript_2744/m.4286 type:complete len:175 (-) Transcript_2744:68-592(-)
MPKVITFRPLVYTNAKKNLKDDEFCVFHCRRCGVHALITDCDLWEMPRRKTDKAVVLDTSKWVVRSSMVEAPDVEKVRRDKGMEKQYNHLCSSCGQRLAYQSHAHGSTDGKLMYIRETMEIPWHKKKTPWICRVCRFVCQTEEQLDVHKKQRQHFWNANEVAEQDEAPRPVTIG